MRPPRDGCFLRRVGGVFGWSICWRHTWFALLADILGSEDGMKLRTTVRVLLACKGATLGIHVGDGIGY